MKNPEYYPPYQYLKQVLTNCPKVGLTYMLLWQFADEKHKIKILKDKIREQFLCTPTKLKNDAMILMRDGLIDMHETEKFVHFELTGWEEDFDVDY